MAVRILLSITSPSTGRIWMVTSRPTSDDQATADFCTSTTPPSVTPERNVMMAMSSTSVRPATERSGTMGVMRRVAGARTASGAGSAHPASAMEHHLAVAELHAGKIEGVEQRQFVRREDDGGPQLVELGEEPHQPERQLGIDIAGRLVREQNVGPADDRAGNGGALLLAA